jgi:acyl-CoA reductase-like NAD-dependent aldehyde dehydrogenase
MSIPFTYEEAFAHYAPIMRERWARSTAAERAYASAEIRDVLKLHDERIAYVAKLYAELDAIRDASMADLRGGVKRAHGKSA